MIYINKQTNILLVINNDRKIKLDKIFKKAYKTLFIEHIFLPRYKTEQIVEGFTLGSHVKKQSCEDDGSFPTRQEEPEESAAEKIYASLRECREQVLVL